MFPSPFQYSRPGSLAEALAVLQQFGDSARLLAGGHSLLPAMKLRLATPQVLVDIGELSELQGIAIGANEVVIGATTTHAVIEHDPVLASAAPLLPIVAAQIADPAVRNRGTIGGALANGDPTADWPAAMIAMDAQLDIVGAAGARHHPSAIGLG